MVLLSLLSLASARPAAADPCGPPVTSVIACENTLPGDPASDWQVSGAGDSTIQGFATSMSVNVGQAESFKINTPAASYHIDILRIGYYQGDGARKVVSNMLPTATLPQTQPDCVNDTGPTGLIDCGNWAVSASWTVPADAVSGLYVAHLVRDDTGGSSLIPFVVRNDASHSDILYQTDDETWQAYNSYGGNSLYQCTVNCPPGNPKGYKGASKVSYNRPWHTALDDDGHSWFMYAEYPMIRFLEENGYDVSYTSGVDVSQPGYTSTIEQHKVFLTAGHDEYWSGQQRANVTAARDAGVNLAFFSGNEVFWKTRWEPSIDGSSTPNRTLVTYKETHYDAPTDPQDPPTWTGSWMDPRFSPPGDGGNPQNSLTGQLFDVNSGSTDITVPSQYSKLRFWRNTRVAGLSPGDSTTLAGGTNDLGYEWDVDADNGFRPPGLMDMSSTTSTNAEVFTDYGSTTQPGSTATHHLTLYRAASGALVFGAGTVQWSWGLDQATGSGNAGSLAPPDRDMQQATVNLLADMGAQPATLMSKVTPATASTDTTPPTSTITSPAQDATLSDGSPVTVSGTATDAGGGVVAGVEVSTDGGTTWHPATTMSAANTSVTWSYSWIAHGNPTTTIKTRAVDDSGNLERPSSGTTVNVTCPCSIWGTGTSPTTVDSGDPASAEVGVKFSTDTPGYVTGIRFYKASTNTGTHIGNLWTAGGQLLASATFTGESASGWQQVSFSQPVPLDKNTTYVASYFAPNGHYAQDGSYFYTTPPMGTNPTITNVDSPPLHALRNTNGVVNGVYSYAGTSTFPTSSADASNYWVDVVFAPGSAPTVPAAPTGVTATAGNAAATVSWTAPGNGGSAITSYTVTPYIGATAQTPMTVTGSPPATSATVTGLTNGTSYTFTVTATNANGTGPASAPSNAVTPSTPPAVTSVTPAAGSTGNPVSVAASATFSEAVVPSSVSFAVQDSGGNNVAGSVSFDAGNTVATFTPSSSLAASTTYSATVSGAQNTSGTPMSSSFTWSFSTAGPQCPCSIWQNGTPSGAVDAADTSAVNLGVQFQAAGSGFITGVRFYKETDNTGSHTGSLWSSTGTLLATGTFSGETGSGWQELDFSSPVPVTAGTTYVASYHTDTGHYAATSGGLSSAVTNGPLTALASGGVYAYGPASAFPSSSFNASNYWVDVVYSQSAGTTPPAVTSVTPAAGSTGNPVSAAASATFSQAVVPGTASFTMVDSSGDNVAGTVGFSSGNTVATFTPSSSLAASTTYTATVSGAQNTSGTPMSSPFTWSFSTGAVAQCPCSIWQNGTPSGAVDAADTSAVNLGVQFQAAGSGFITGVRFYKETDNTGSHTGSLWSSTGTLLATGTFSGETGSGWQELDFSSPVAVTAGTTYVASYHTDTGHYAATSGGLSSAVTNGPLTALASGGVYAYGPASAFPSSSFNAHNYWVDVVYSQSAGTRPPAVTSVTPAAGSTGNPVSVAASATFSEAVVPSSVSFAVQDSGGNNVAGSVSFDAGNTVATFTPSSSLAASTTYSATVSGAQNTSGTPMSSSFTWSFSTAGPQCPCSIWQNGTPSGAVDAADTSAVNLGVQFQAAGSGFITGVRFYKETDNTGSHTGSLWSSTGTLLATGTFSGETGSGWQELDFSSPVPVTAGTTYVASYHTDTGHYAATSGGLSSAVTNGPLTALASGGVYAYGPASAFPSSSFNASNYWVDVVYSQSAGTTPPAVTSVTPAAGSTGNPVSAAASATFSQAVVPGTASFTMVDSSGDNVAGTVGFSSGNTVATFTPSSSLAASTTYTATVSGAQNTSGTPMSSPFTWSFSTGAVAQCPCSIWQNGTPSGAVDAADTSAVNLGVQFQAAGSGFITGVRFYKETDNTGSHTGSLWSSTGTLLATGTFSGETGSGWQELDFSSPVAVTAGTTYVASYHTDTGHYAATSGGLSSAVTNGPLTALASGGVYAYGPASAFPSSSFNAHNYWVDVVYSTS